jgi:tetratricopeptide (TPR) repeat protein
MEALKKAEQAKRTAAEGSTAPATAPAATPAVKLELAPAGSSTTTLVPNSVSEKPRNAAAPTLTAAAYTLMTGRVAEVSTPVDVPEQPPQGGIAPPANFAAQAPAVAVQATPALSIDNIVLTPRAAPAAVPRSLPQTRRIPVQWIIAGITLLLGLAGGGFWYYNSMAKYLTQQATMSAPQTSVAVEPPLVVPVPAPLPTATPSVSAPNKITQHAAIKATPAGKPGNGSAAPITVRPPPEKPAAATVPAPVVAVPVVVSTALGEVAVNVPPPVPISISRDAEQNDTLITLQNAYRAYQSSDDGNAQKLYAHVLGRDEHNRDALLGLAAIAVRQKEFVRAQEIYSELLTLDPKDSVAQAGFVSVTSSFDPLQQEARIKALLEQEPGASHLLFTYASFLMQQQRWLEATRTLQSAVQAQRDNADYAFNLAVSFDHLGQIDAAVKYYRMALELSAKQSTSFRPDDVRRRLKAMSSIDSGGASP